MSNNVGGSKDDFSLISFGNVILEKNWLFFKTMIGLSLMFS